MLDRPSPDNEWVQRHHQRLLRAAWLMSGNRTDAEDLVQETLVQAIESWSSFKGLSSEYTWLFSILVRVHQQRRRSIVRAARRVMQWWNLSLQSEHDQDPSAAIARQQWHDSLWRQVSFLPVQQQQAIVLRFGEGLSFAEIGTVMQCPESTARTRVHYGIQSLRNGLTDESKVSAIHPKDDLSQLPSLNENELNIVVLSTVTTKYSANQP